MESPTNEAALIAALRAGDERAFLELVRSHDGMLRRLARGYVPPSLIDEVVQDTWVGVLRGLAQFEGRASLRTWICRILINRARTLGVRSARMVPSSALGGGEDDETAGAALDDAMFTPAGRWTEGPAQWPSHDPEALLAQHELRTLIEGVLQDLPERQRLVVTLRDLHDWTTEEVCNALDLTETNQRVLLHRGRARVRSILERKLTTGAT